MANVIWSSNAEPLMQYPPVHRATKSAGREATMPTEVRIAPSDQSSINRKCRDIGRVGSSVHSLGNRYPLPDVVMAVFAEQYVTRLTESYAVSLDVGRIGGM